MFFPLMVILFVSLKHSGAHASSPSPNAKQQLPFCVLEGEQRAAAWEVEGISHSTLLSYVWPSRIKQGSHDGKIFSPNPYLVEMIMLESQERC